jgi:hypothetical protein
MQIVDLSCHNNGRLPEHECEIRPVVYADYDAAFRPPNLVPRQRAFLRFMADRPRLAKYVKSLAWTLIWKDFKDDDLTEIDRQTWSVFSVMNNVTQLDLASLREIHNNELVRQNPTTLFPAVTELRLLGWMHRGLVKAIISSIDTKKLCSLKLDYLQDEGALPNGAPMSFDITEEYAYHARRSDRSDTVDNELFHRQENSQACIFPGPMWLPLRLLSACFLDSLTHMQIKVASFSMDIDLRSYYTLFHETANLLLRTRGSLKSLVLVFGEDMDFFEETRLHSGCGNHRQFHDSRYNPWCLRIAAAFLNQSLAVLNRNHFLHLEDIRFEGFHVLETATPRQAAAAGLADTFQSIRECPYPNASFTQISCIDCREVFLGYDCVSNMQGFNTALLVNS